MSAVLVWLSGLVIGVGVGMEAEQWLRRRYGGRGTRT